MMETLNGIVREKIIYEENNGSIKNNFIVDYIKEKGVWALYGQEKEADDSHYVCLNVGKCKNVGKEIIYDLGCLHALPFRKKDGDRKYINQFSEPCGFYYKKNQVREFLYPYLAENYCAFKFIYVHNESDGDFEAEYAKKHHAKFWRNGRPYCGKQN